LLPLALELGFASHSHLTREFRRAYGLSPSSLRARVGRRARLAHEVADVLVGRCARL
jgi:AraC-like DNA-binding protein